ncbi:hypothetical protein GGS20DRAFT_199885 [Poronia punctata]|nr:hypothetical protein GGS20DRAFT_199885 [Poronia punctata]
MPGSGSISNMTTYFGRINDKSNHTMSNIGPTDKVIMSADRTREFMSSFNGGGDPVTALGVRGNQTNPGSRAADVSRQIDAAMAALNSP